MSFDLAMRKAAKLADSAVNRAMRKYRKGHVTDEDDLTGVLVGNLDAEFDKSDGVIRWSSSILRHRKGVAGEEKNVGADLIINVSINTPIIKYSKGVLIQAKRHEPNSSMSTKQYNDLVDQCNKMLSISSASFVFDYAKDGMRCASASKISGSTNRNLYDATNWTSYRFFLELFRCPIGDPKINSAAASDLPAPFILKIYGEGDISSE